MMLQPSGYGHAPPTLADLGVCRLYAYDVECMMLNA